MGEYGQLLGHIDKPDSAGSLTCMISASRLPSGYESGRFHLLGLGIYFALDPDAVMLFCGLNRHGGSPPIAPQGAPVDPRAARGMMVGYPPSVMMSPSGTHRIPFASMPNGEILILGPEITSDM